MDAGDFIKNSEDWVASKRQSETSAGLVEQLEAVKTVVELKKNADYLRCV